MADGYTGDHADFINAAKQTAQVREDIDGTMKSLEGQLSELQGAWKGAAATAFHQLIERYNADLTKLTQALQGISEQLNAAGGTYQAQEDEHSAAFSNVTQALG